jgi:hypothetical protein
VKRGRDCSFTLHWNEESAPNLGEGISRTSKDVPLYRVLVVFPGNKPMKELIRAANKREAAKFAGNRYPQAVSIEVIGKA